MVFCQNCGNEIEEGATFCQNCGTNLKKENKEKLLKRGIKRINLPAIISGVITWIIILVLFAIAYSGKFIDNATTALTLIFIQLLSSGVAGYIGNTNYKNGIVNGGILCILPTILTTYYGGLSGLIVGFILFLCFGIVGGILGCFTNKEII